MSEKFFKFSTQFDFSNIDQIILKFNSIVGWSKLQKRLRGLAHESAENPLWADFLFRHHPLELAFDQAVRHYRNTGRYPWKKCTSDQIRLYSFMATFLAVYERLSDSAQSRLIGRISSSLDGESTLSQMASELRKVVDLQNNGFAINFHDPECGAGYDFFAMRDGFEIEIECKHLSADIGRKIHRIKIYRLSKIIRPFIKECLESKTRGILVNVEIPDRLLGDIKTQRSIFELINKAICEEESIIIGGNMRASTVSFGLEQTPFNSTEWDSQIAKKAEAFLHERFGLEQAHAIFAWNPGKCAIVVRVVSEKRDQVMSRIIKKLKDDAKKQFSHERPALLNVHLADIDEIELTSLVDQGGKTKINIFEYMSYEVMAARPSLVCLEWSIDGEIVRSKALTGEELRISSREQGKLYPVKNLEHPQADLI